MFIIIIEKEGPWKTILNQVKAKKAGIWANNL